jgi:hypothetical protein
MKKSNPKTTKAVIKSINNKTPLKYIDTIINQNLTNTGTVLNFTFPTTQGYTNGDRTGDEIEIVHFEIRTYFLYGDATGNAARLVWYQSNGVANIFSPTGILAPGPGGIPSITSMYDSFVEKTQVKILLDETYVCCQTSKTPIVLTYHKLAPKIKRSAFNSGGSVPYTGQFSLCCLSDSFVLPNPVLQGVVRMYYRDV